MNSFAYLKVFLRCGEAPRSDIKDNYYIIITFIIGIKNY
jgi:hypothetical protein